MNPDLHSPASQPASLHILHYIIQHCCPTRASSISAQATTALKSHFPPQWGCKFAKSLQRQGQLLDTRQENNHVVVVFLLWYYELSSVLCHHTRTEYMYMQKEWWWWPATPVLPMMDYLITFRHYSRLWPRNQSVHERQSLPQTRSSLSSRWIREHCSAGQLTNDHYPSSSWMSLPTVNVFTFNFQQQQKTLLTSG